MEGNQPCTPQGKSRRAYPPRRGDDNATHQPACPHVRGIRCTSPLSGFLDTLVSQLRAIRETLHLVGASIIEYAPGDAAASREAVLSSLTDEVRTLLTGP